jgi:hypothetical protein
MAMSRRPFRRILGKRLLLGRAREGVYKDSQAQVVGSDVTAAMYETMISAKILALWNLYCL